MNTISNLYQLLEQSKHITNKGIHFINKDEESDFTSFESFYRKVKQYADSLSRILDKSVENIILYQTHSLDFLISFWACITLGIPAVPVSVSNLNNSVEKLDKIHKTLKNAVVILDSCNYYQVNSRIDKRKLITFEYRETNFELDKEIKNPASCDIALIQFSSGSTSDPKGIKLSHKNLVTNLSDIANLTDLNAGDSMCSWLPFTHDMGLIFFHLTGMYSGIDQYYIDPIQFIRRPLILLNVVAKFNITITGSPNFGINLLNKHIKGKDLSLNLHGLKAFYLGAEHISAKACFMFINNMKPFGMNDNVLKPGYGLAESCVAVSSTRINETMKTVKIANMNLNIGAKVNYSNNTSREYVCCGRAINNCSIRIVDNSGIELERDYVGRIEIKGENVSKGYYGAPDNSEWIYTGDIGFLTSDAELVILDREKNIIIQNGVNYSATDIENIIEDEFSEYKRKTAAVSLFSVEEEKENVFIGIVNNRAGILEAETKKLRVFVQKNISCYISGVVGIPYIPKTTSGKKQHYIVKGWIESALN